MEATYLSRRSEPAISLSVSGPRASFIHTLAPTMPDKIGMCDYKSLETATLKFRLKLVFETWSYSTFWIHITDFYTPTTLVT